MSSLWRTQRPRFPLYLPDGRGRDYYIKFDNGGYWSTQFSLKKKPDYERSFYSNFHSLFHQAAPFKYWGNGHGRETYILQTNGLFHDQKPLCAYKLTDFLRDGKRGTKFDNFKRKLFMSVSEKKYNEHLKKFEKKLIQRLYSEPMKIKKMLRKNNYEINLTDSNDTMGNKIYDLKKSFSSNLAYRGKYKPCVTENPKEYNGLRDIINMEENKNNNMGKELVNKNESDYDKEFKKGFNTICNFHNKFDKKRKNITINTNEEYSQKFNHVNDKTFRKYFDYNKTNNLINNDRQEYKFTDPNNINNYKMKVAFNFKNKPKKGKIKLKNFE